MRYLVRQTFTPDKEYIEAVGISADRLNRPTTGIVTGSKYFEVDTGKHYKFSEDLSRWLCVDVPMAVRLVDDASTDSRVHAIAGADLVVVGPIVDAIRPPDYVSDVTPYAAYGITDPGWYVFAQIDAKDGITVTADTTVQGAAGFVATPGGNHVDVAVRFDVAALSQKITIVWGDETEIFIFRAIDLGIRNLDYRTTFYVYDVAQFTTWAYALTTDTEFVADKHYYTKDGDVYTEATVTAGDAVPADTYYNHSKVTFSGMARNITYVCTTEIDCPMEFVLPEIEDDTHGCWFEIRCMHAGEYSMTLLPPEGVKIATEHTQKETKGMNDIVLHYNSINGVKLWRFLNTHSSIPA